MRIEHCYSDEELRKLQGLLLEILGKIDELCRKHDIPYFAVGGTLLGAVRHKGFIPWDDDVDLGMIREDYDRFLEIAKRELPSEYFVLNFQENSHFPASFSKICKKNTVFVEYEVRKLKYPHCVFIDIMPYDRAPSDEKDRKSFLSKGSFLHQMFKTRMLWTVSSLVPSKKKRIGKIVRPVLHALLLPISPKLIYKRMLKQMTRFNDRKSSDSFLSFWSTERFAHPESFFRDLENVPFENVSLPIPKQYDKILTKQYGDYMQLPPVEKRKTHSPFMFEI